MFFFLLHFGHFFFCSVCLLDFASLRLTFLFIFSWSLKKVDINSQNLQKKYCNMWFFKAMCAGSWHTLFFLAVYDTPFTTELNCFLITHLSFLSWLWKMPYLTVLISIKEAIYLINRLSNFRIILKHFFNTLYERWIYACCHMNLIHEYHATHVVHPNNGQIWFYNKSD